MSKSTIRSYNQEKTYGADRAKAVLIGVVLSAFFWVPLIGIISNAIS